MQLWGFRQRDAMVYDDGFRVVWKKLQRAEMRRVLATLRRLT
jgi:hypothetical protein